MDINGFGPFMNVIDAPDGFRRPLYWCNLTIKRAIEYLLIMHNLRFDYQTVFGTVRNAIGQRAFLYAASGMSLADFGQAFPVGSEKQYREQIEDGLSAYLPTHVPDVLPAEADDYPDIAAHEEEKEAKPIDWSEWLIALRKVGFTLTEIDDMTWPGMITALKQASGVKEENPADMFF